MFSYQTEKKRTGNANFFNIEIDSPKDIGFKMRYAFTHVSNVSISGRISQR